jgi:hypothetical protein
MSDVNENPVTPPDDDRPTGDTSPDAPHGEYGDDSPYDYGPPEKAKRGQVPYTGAQPPPRPPRGRGPLYIVLGCLLGCGLCCILPLCAVTAGGAIIASLVEEVTVHQQQAIRVDPDEPITLEVENVVGRIDIKPTSGSEVIIEYTKQASDFSSDDAQRALDNLVVVIDEPTPNTITITVRQEADDNFFTFWSNQVDLTVRVPGAVDVTARNDIGGVYVRDGVPVRSMELETDIGEVKFWGDLPTDPDANLQIETNLGAITVHLARDAYLEVQASVDVGDVSVDDSLSVSGADSDQDGGGKTWRGTFGTGDDDPPLLTLSTDAGEITIERR